MLEIMKKEMDKMWETKLEVFQKETLKAILEPLKEHTDKMIESLQKHLEEFIISLHTEHQKSTDQWAQGLTKLSHDRSGKSSGRLEK